MKIPVLSLLIACFALPHAQLEATNSQLWGTNGELWDPGNSRLLDFSDVGYMNGDVPIPDWPVGVDVTDYGAAPNDGVDDAQAFNDAIAACPPNHAVFVPNGEYTILQKVVLDKDYIVLRGEDMYQTVLFIPKNLSEVYIIEEGWDPNDPSKRSTPPGAFLEVTGGTHRSIENLTVRFRDQMKMNHWEHKGNDAIEVKNADDSWIRNVYIVNADHGIMLAGVSQSSFINIIFDHFYWRQGPQARERVGHMAFKPNSTKCLFHNIEILGGTSHDFDIDGGTKENVFSNISGTRPQFAAHGPGAYGNLHTQVDTGWSTRMDTAKQDFSQQTYWNVSGEETLSTDEIVETKDHVFVGYDGGLATTSTSTFWYEDIEAQQLTPQNLYLAQLEYFGKPMPEGPPPPPASDSGDVIHVLATEDTFTDFRSGGDSLADPHSSTLDARFPMYFKFDLQDADLSSVHRVRMVVGANNVNDTSEFTVWSVDDDNWSEDTMTYNNRPLPQASLDSIQIEEPSSARQIEFDVTSFVQAEWAGDKVVTINMVRDAGGGSIQSRDKWWPATLIIEQVADPVPGAPSAPKGIQTESMVGNIRLDWEDNPESDVATYNVYRSPFSEGEAGYDRPIAMGLVTSDFVDVDSNGDWRVGMMRHDTVYFYRIVAVDEHGNESPKSIEVAGSVLTPPYVTPINIGPGFVQSTINLNDGSAGSAYNGSLASLASDPEGDPLYFFKVDGPNWLTVEPDGTLGGTPGPADLGTNSFTIQVTSLGGYDQAVCEITVVFDTTPPSLPTGLAATPGDSSVSLSWDANTEGDLDSYNVYRSTASDSYGSALATGLTSPSYVDGSAVNGTTYYYVVTAVDASTNESAESSEVSAVPTITADTTPPASPGALAATPGNGSVTLDWDDNGEGDLASYNVYRSTSSGSYGAALATGLTSSDYVDTTAVNGTTYYYLVTAVDTSANQSAQSNEVIAMPSSVIFGTMFTGGRTHTDSDWSNGLPSSTNYGGIAADGIIDVNSGFYVIQNGYTMNNSFGGPSCSDGEWTLNAGVLSANSFSTNNHLLTINGGIFESTTSSGDINIGNSAASTLILNGGTVSTLDTFTLRNGSSMQVNGGTVSIGNNLLMQDDSVFTMTGGSLDVSGDLGGSPFYEGVIGSMSFNGGTVTAGSLRSSSKPASPVAFVFGGTSSGSVTAVSLSGGSGNRTIDFLPGTQMTLTITGVDEWAGTEWNAGRLTYNGQDYTTLGTWAAVTATNGLGSRSNFVYDSATERLSLFTGVYQDDFSNAPVVENEGSATSPWINSNIAMPTAGNFKFIDSNHMGITHDGSGIDFSGSNTGWLLINTESWATGDYTVTFDGRVSSGTLYWDVIGGNGSGNLSVRLWMNRSLPQVRATSAGTADRLGQNNAAGDTAGLATDAVAAGSFTNTTMASQSLNITLTDAHVGSPNDYILIGWAGASGLIDNLSVTTMPAVSNNAPAFTNDPLTALGATEDTAYTDSIAGSATDADAGDTLSYSKTSGSAWLTVASNGDLSGTPTNGDVGLNSFTVEVSDGNGGTDSSTLEISVANVNDDPIWNSDPVEETAATEDAAYSSTLADDASDIDTDDTLIFAKVSGPAWLSVAGNGTLLGTPLNSDVGANVFTVSVSDGTATAVEVTLGVTVNNVNDDPVFTADPISKPAAMEDATYSDTIAGSASDEDVGDSLSYGKTGGPAWLSVATDGTLSGIPASGDVGLNSFTIEVSDGNGGTDSATLEIMVDVETVPPAAPTGLAGTTGDGSVTLDWNDNSEDDLASYSVYRSTTSGIYGAELVTGLTASDYTDMTAVNGTTYYYVVTATDTNSNESAQSSEISATPEPPSAANFTTFAELDSATPGDVFPANSTFSSPSGGADVQSVVFDFYLTTQATLPPGVEVLVDMGADASGASIVLDNGRIIFRAKNADNLYVTSIPLSASTSYRVTGSLLLNDSGDDEMRLYLNGADGVDPAFTSDVATVANLGDWAGANGSGYGVVGGGIVLGGTAISPGKLNNTDENPFTGTLDSGLNIYYNTSLDLVAVITPPAAPSSLVATAGIGSVDLDWSDNAEADFASYKVHRSETAGSGYLEVASGLTTSDWTDLSVTDNTVYYYVVTALDDSGNESVFSSEGSVRPGLVVSTAVSEIPVDGTIGGSLADIDHSDNSYQTVTEIDNGTTSILEHIWVFDVTAAEVVTVYLEAYHTANTEGDAFIFAYSTDGVNYTDMVTVTETADSDSAYYYALPSGTSGTVYVRVHDTDATPGNTQLDSIVIDELLIESEESSVAPFAALTPAPEDGGINLPVESDLSWKAGLYTGTHDVYFGTTASPAFQGNQPGTSFDPGSLAPNTTYYWSVTEVNATGSMAGPIWSFTTEADLVPDVLHWTFDGGSGATVVDGSGNARDGSIHSGALWSTDTPNGSAFSMDLSGGAHIEDADAGNYLNGLAAVTVSLWIKSDLANTDNGFLLTNTPNGQDDRLGGRYDAAGWAGGGSNLIKASVSTTGGSRALESASNVQTTAWQHIALTWSDGGSPKLYIDGVETAYTDAPAAVTGTLNNVTTLFLGKGAKDGSSGGWSGLVDEVRIYSRELNAAEILMLSQ